MCFSQQRRANFARQNFQKWSQTVSFFEHFDLQMRFSLQQLAIFWHRNFQKWSEHAVFCTFWLANVLLATAACHFSTSQLPKVVRTCCVLCICASRYSGVQNFICPLNWYLRTRRFTEPTFRPSQPTNHWKNKAIRDFPNISRVWIFLLTFAQLYLLSSDSTSLLCFSSSDSASLLCFFNCPYYCRKLDF